MTPFEETLLTDNGIRLQVAFDGYLQRIIIDILTPNRVDSAPLLVRLDGVEIGEVG